MKRGFIFSIEAIMSAALVLSAIGLTAYGSHYWEPQDNSLKLLTQADAAQMLYTGGPATPLDYSNTVCEKIAYYGAATKTVGEKKACRGYR